MKNQIESERSGIESDIRSTRGVRHCTLPHSIVAPRPPKLPSLSAVESKSNRRHHAPARRHPFERTNLRRAPGNQRQSFRGTPRSLLPRGRPSIPTSADARAIGKARAQRRTSSKKINSMRRSAIRTRSISQAARPREIDLGLPFRFAAATPQRGSTPERSGFAVRFRRGRDRYRIAIPRRGGSDLDPRVAAMGEDRHRAIQRGRGRGNRPPHGGRGRGSDRFRAPREVKAPTPIRACSKMDKDRSCVRQRCRARPQSLPVSPRARDGFGAMASRSTRN